MTERGAIEAALREAGMLGAIAATQALGGGCIDRVLHVTFEGGSSVVVKVGAPGDATRLHAEAEGLRRLGSAGVVVVPEVIADGVHGDHAVLVMTMLPAARPVDDAWRRFGAQLASLHALDAGSRYGFDHDNFLGASPQPNGWSDDWARFNAEARLAPHVERAARRGLLEPSERARLERVIDRLDDILPRRPHPALLHGDLWSGNALATTTEDGRVEIAVIDPAVSIGDGWADVAMMRLFGGFPRSCHDAYEHGVGRPDDLEDRMAVYQLYHVLNHVNLFGRGYVGQAMGLAARVGG